MEKIRLYRDRDWLYQKYWVEKLSVPQIAKECQTYNYIIFNWMKKLNIKTRTLSEAGKLSHQDKTLKARQCKTFYKNNPKPWHDADKLYKEHVFHKKSITQITKEWSAGENTISEWLGRHNIPITHFCGRDVGGSKNPRWNGGVSEYPNHAFFKRQRLLILEHAGGKCETCSKRANVVHHVDGCSDNHELSNLMALCHKCHWLLHGNNRTDYVHEYGKTPKELATYFNVSPKVIYGWNRSFLGKQKLLSK